MQLSTGELARAGGVSEKAVRLYTERGLLDAARTARGSRRFDVRARERLDRITAMRRLDLPLAAIRAVLDDDDPVAAFDELWGARRNRFGELLAAGERARDLLAAGEPIDVEVVVRPAPRHLRLSLEAHGRLDELPGLISRATASLFETLMAADVALDGFPYVEYLERATAGYRARVAVHVPVARIVEPVGAQVLSAREACFEAVVGLGASAASDQGFVVAVHDHLSRGRFDPRAVLSGNNREVYRPEFGDPSAAGTVMEVCVPIER